MQPLQILPPISHLVAILFRHILLFEIQKFEMTERDVTLLSFRYV